MWGSSGTGKTLLLVETLRIMLAYYKLQKIETEVIVLTYHDDIDESSELLKDLYTKYLPSIIEDKTIKITTFKQLCKGKLQCNLRVDALCTLDWVKFWKSAQIVFVISV